MCRLRFGRLHAAIRVLLPIIDIQECPAADPAIAALLVATLNDLVAET